MAVWSITKISNCIHNKRMDAERYHPSFLENENSLKRRNYKNLKYYVQEMTGGATPLGAKYLDTGIPFIRVQNIRNNFMDLTDIVYINEAIHNGQLHRSQIKKGDILLTITGVSYGNAATAYKELGAANMNQHSVRIQVKNGLIPEFLSTFLNSRFGRLQSDSKITGNTRPALTYPEINSFIIPDISVNEQINIADIVNKSIKVKLLSENLYTQATQLLEQELGLDKVSFEKSNGYVAKFSEVITNNRSDADYYQLKYRILDKYIAYVSTVQLSSLCSLIKGFEVGSSAYTEEGPHFIRVSNLTKEGFKTGTSDKHISTTTYEALKLYQPELGDILLTKDGTIGVCYVVDEYVEGIISSGIMKLKMKESIIPKEYLALAINSEFCQMQAERECSGALISHWKPEQIRKLRVPLIDEIVMNQIASLVEESKRLRKESQQLLEHAKNRVEELIEQSIE